MIPRDLADVRLAPDELQGGSGIVQSRAKQWDYSAAAVLVVVRAAKVTSPPRRFS